MRRHKSARAAQKRRPLLSKADFFNNIDLCRTQRLARRNDIEAIVADWVADRPAQEAMCMLQNAGIPAARMLRVAELPEFDYFRERGIFRLETHPYLDEPYHAEAMHAKFSGLAPPPERCAPVAGEHTAEVMREWLHLDEDRITDLVARGVLEPVSEKVRNALDELKGDANA